MSNKEIYKEYSDNPIEWMKKNECVTSKDITLKMMDIALKQGQNLPLHNVRKCVFCDNPPLNKHAYCEEHMKSDDWS